MDSSDIVAVFGRRLEIISLRRFIHSPLQILKDTRVLSIQQSDDPVDNAIVFLQRFSASTHPDA
ncbi:hypothetical protein D3C75_1189540 [compost metagenome]